ncbi:MAG TPA: hypothetical protein VF624_02880 [Tepidisphaeraceae bacterium]|jgi:hypothetical protein
MRTLNYFNLVSVLVLASSGCQGDATDDASMQTRQDAALKDPFGYGPSQPQPNNRTTPPAKPNRDNSTQGQAELFKNP